MQEWTTWKIGKFVCEYHDPSHTYVVNGVIAKSVTQLIHFAFPDKYSGIDEETLGKAAEYGSRVHNAIQSYEETGEYLEDCPELRDYVFLKKQHGFECLKNEIPIIIEYDGMVFAGRLDMLIKNKDGKLEIGDIKTTSALDKMYLAYQLNLYRIGYMQCYGENIESLSYLWLNSKNPKYRKRKYNNLPINEQIIYELMKQYKKSKEENK